MKPRHLLGVVGMSFSLALTGCALDDVDAEKVAEGINFMKEIGEASEDIKKNGLNEDNIGKTKDLMEKSKELGIYDEISEEIGTEADELVEQIEKQTNEQAKSDKKDKNKDKKKEKSEKKEKKEKSKDKSKKSRTDNETSVKGKKGSSK